MPRAAAAGWRRRALVLGIFLPVDALQLARAAPAAGPQEASGGQLRLPQDIVWEDWQVVREQRAILKSSALRKQQCREVSAKSLSKGAGELIRVCGVGCAGETVCSGSLSSGRWSIEDRRRCRFGLVPPITPPRKAGGHFDDSVRFVEIESRRRRRFAG